MQCFDPAESMMQRNIIPNGLNMVVADSNPLTVSVDTST